MLKLREHGTISTFYTKGIILGVRVLFIEMVWFKIELKTNFFQMEVFCNLIISFISFCTKIPQIPKQYQDMVEPFVQLSAVIIASTPLLSPCLDFQERNDRYLVFLDEKNSFTSKCPFVKFRAMHMT